MDPLFVYVTAGDRKEAETIGRALVEARLAACANVLEGVHSIYWWQGAVEESVEAVLIAKSRKGLLDDLIAKVRALHSYECPCVVAMPIVAGNPDFLDWIAAETETRS